jgi:cation diffusion facilitator CzcD-associated flavoprotein CzcO
MSFDTEVLIIGAGMSGLGLAVQIIRKYGIRNFELVEKSEDVGGTWLANTYPGCGCDVSDPFHQSLVQFIDIMADMVRSHHTFTPTASP